MEYVPCIGNSSYSFWRILLKLYRCFKDSLKICILFFQNPEIIFYHFFRIFNLDIFRALILQIGERGGSVVECRTPEREVRGSRPTAAVLCPWARHFTPRKYWLITQEAMAPSRHDWKIVDWDVKPQHNQPTADMYMEYVPCIGNSS